MIERESDDDDDDDDSRAKFIELQFFIQVCVLFGDKFVRTRAWCICMQMLHLRANIVCV